MKVRFDDIPDAGLPLVLSETSWFPEGDWERLGPLSGEAFLSRQDNRIVMEGRLAFSVRFACDRCLEPFVDQQDCRFRVEFEHLGASDPYWLTEDHHCPATEMDVVVLREPEIDIEAAMTQQVLLLLPVKRLCAEGCRGLCPTCGCNMNTEPCACRDQVRDSPFQVLARLKEK